MKSKSRDRDKELEELKKEIEKIVGKAEVEKITKIVEMSYQFDEMPDYKITYNTVGGKNHAIKK